MIRRYLVSLVALLWLAVVPALGQVIGVPPVITGLNTLKCTNNGTNTVCTDTANRWSCTTGIPQGLKLQLQHRGRMP
jgi:hypothetical protein